METRTEGRHGWIEVAHGGVHVLTKGDEELRQRLVAALEEADGDSLADVVTDELTTGGVRRAPDFAIVDESEGRVLVRGSASVHLTGSEGGTHEVLAPRRGPWTDEDLEQGVTLAVLGTGEPAVETEPETSGTEEASAGAEPIAPRGWSMPSVFAAKGSAPSPAQGPGAGLSLVPGGSERSGADEPEAAPPAGVGAEEPGPPADPGEVVEAPAPEPQDLPDAEADRPAEEGEAPPSAEAAISSPVGGPTEEDDELPSFDFLFGNTGNHRSSLLAALDEEEQEPSAIDSGPVAAAGGYQPKEDPTNTTLAPPAEDETEAEDAPPEEQEADASAPDVLPGGLPPMPGPVEAPEPETAGEGSPEPVAPIDAGPPAPVAAEPDAGPDLGGRPQLVDGHLVSSRVRTGADEGDQGASAGEHHSGVQPGMISSVPWGESGAGQSPAPGPTGVAAGLPVTTPGQLSSEDEEEGTGEIPSGPMVLAVQCSRGHHNAPHATRCRVCGQDLPTQQPEQTPRPSLGLLRLSTGDVVPLDRGILIGRAPRAGAEASGAGAPHLVRVASPDNEISRNHLEIVLDGWHVLVRDLGSTNGTTVALPGSSPVRVRPGDQQTIEPGTTITLADQVSMVFEVTG